MSATYFLDISSARAQSFTAIIGKKGLASRSEVSTTALWYSNLAAQCFEDSRELHHRQGSLVTHWWTPRNRLYCPHCICERWMNELRHLGSIVNAEPSRNAAGLPCLLILHTHSFQIVILLGVSALIVEARILHGHRLSSNAWQNPELGLLSLLYFNRSRSKSPWRSFFDLKYCRQWIEHHRFWLD